MGSEERSPRFENPSAGKFAPPPPARDPFAREPFYKRWWFTPLIIALYSAKFWLFGTHRSRGLWGLLIALIAAAVQFLQGWARHDQAEDDPYTPPTHLTR